MLAIRRLLRQAASTSRIPKNSFNSSAEVQRLEGKVALITGAANGIGAATAKLFVENGAKVVIADIDDKQGKMLASSLQNSSSSPSCIYIHCDVTNEQDIKVAVDTTVNTFGHLDVMHSNAGVLMGSKPSSSIANMDASELDYIYSVNVRGAALCIKHAARVMVSTEGGGTTGRTGEGCCSILCTASVASTLAGMALHPYTVSKHALVGLVKSCACELAHFGVRVNCISPNGVVTGLLCSHSRHLKPASGGISASIVAGDEFGGSVDLRKMMEPCDIARAALFLASNESKYVSGHNLVVDGSFTASAAMNLYKSLQKGEIEFVD